MMISYTPRNALIRFFSYTQTSPRLCIRNPASAGIRTGFTDTDFAPGQSRKSLSILSVPEGLSARRTPCIRTNAQRSADRYPLPDNTAYYHYNKPLSQSQDFDTVFVIIDKLNKQKLCNPTKERRGKSQHFRLPAFSASFLAYFDMRTISFRLLSGQSRSRNSAGILFSMIASMTPFPKSFAVSG